MPTTYKVLGQVAPSAGADTALYTGPSSTQTVISTISVCNRSASEGTFRIFLRPNDETLANKHYLVYDAPVIGNDVINLTLGITMDASDVLYVRASSADFSFNCFGSEIT